MSENQYNSIVSLLWAMFLSDTAYRAHSLWVAAICVLLFVVLIILHFVADHKAKNPVIKKLN